MRALYSLPVVMTAALSVTGCNAVLGVEDVSLAQQDAGVSDAPVVCNVAPTFSLVTSNPVTSRLTRRTSDGGPSMLFLLNAEAKPDALGLLLYKNMGGHGDFTAPGSYPLTANDSRLESCGICLLISVDYDRTAMKYAETYFALAQGTLTLNKSDETGMSGSLQNLKFRHVETANNMTKDASDGCTASVTNVQFDLTYSTN